MISAETDNFNNICEGATVTISDGNYQNAAVDNSISSYYLCSPANECTEVQVVGTHATLTLDLGSVTQISTIVFVGMEDVLEAVDGYGNMKRRYGLSADPFDTTTNNEIT